jgi:hypothetical protein
LLSLRSDISLRSVCLGIFFCTPFDPTSAFEEELLHQNLFLGFRSRSDFEEVRLDIASLVRRLAFVPGIRVQLRTALRFRFLGKREESSLRDRASSVGLRHQPRIWAPRQWCAFGLQCLGLLVNACTPLENACQAKKRIVAKMAEIRGGCCPQLDIYKMKKPQDPVIL